MTLMVCDICAGPNFQFMDLQLENGGECKHSDVLESCWDCDALGEEESSARVEAAMARRRKQRDEHFVRLHGPVVKRRDEKAVEVKMLPTISLNGVAEEQVRKPVESKYLKRLKSRSPRSNGVVSVPTAPIRTQTWPMYQSSGEVGETFTAVESVAQSPNTKFAYGRCTTCTTTSDGMTKESQQIDALTLAITELSLNIEGNPSSDFDGVESEVELIYTQERGKCLPVHREARELKPILKNHKRRPVQADSDRYIHPTIKEISFAEMSNIGTPLLPPADVPTHKTRRYSSNYKVRIANEKFRKDLASAVFGGT